MTFPLSIRAVHLYKQGVFSCILFCLNEPQLFAAHPLQKEHLSVFCSVLSSNLSCCFGGIKLTVSFSKKMFAKRHYLFAFVTVAR